MLYQLPKNGVGNFENLKISLESALQKIAEIYSNLPCDGEIKIILSVYDGVRQLSDPDTEPSGKWDIKADVSGIYSRRTCAVIDNLADYIL